MGPHVSPPDLVNTARSASPREMVSSGSIEWQESNERQTKNSPPGEPFSVRVRAGRGHFGAADDRYAQVHPPVPGTDEARILSALQASRFSLVQVKGRHPTIGLMLEDHAAGAGGLAY